MSHATGVLGQSLGITLLITANLIDYPGTV